MNILYINHYAGSPEMGMEFRTYYLASEWVKMGHNVTIIAGDYSHLRRKNPEVSENFQTEIIDGIKYMWIKTGEYDGNGVKRAMSMFRFVSTLRKNARDIVENENPDVVITSSTYPLDTFAGQKMKKIKKDIKLVHEIHDMWPITLIEVGNMPKYHPFVVMMQIGENSFCKNSDYVCSLLPAAKDYLIKHGMKAEKFFHVSNGIVESEWENYDKIPEDYVKIFDKIHSEGKKVICFFGSHTKSYCLDNLAKACIDNDDVAAVFIGGGIYKKELMEKYSKYEDSIYFLDSISKTSIPDLFNYIDATYVAAMDNDMFRYGVCMNKLFDSMMGAKPIIYAINAPNNYIVDYNCGINVESENLEELKKGIEKFVNLDEETLNQMGKNGRKAIEENFTYHKLAEKFLKGLEN